MGVLFSRFRAKPSPKELLEDIQKEIDSLEEYKRSTEVQQKAVVGSLVFYSVLLYIIIAAMFIFYSYPINTKEKIVYSVPFLIFPFILYILKKFLQWYFLQKIRHNEENLIELKKKKRSILDFAMETETYKVVKELLEKYDPVYYRRIFEPKPAIEAPPTPSLRGSFADIDLRRRNISPRGSSPIALGGPGQTMAMNTSAGSPNIFPLYSGKPLTNPPYPTAQFFQRGGPQFVRPPAPPMPRPVLPRERTLVDRLVDYLVGDGPSNRYALICRQCQSHNGMALKEEFDYVAFRCCYCFQFNPPRNQQPPPPRLTLPAPPPSAPAITDAPSDASTSSENEMDNLSDNDISPETIENEDTNESNSVKEDPTHRLSVSSENEIQANLVEDKPYDTPHASDTDVEEFPNRKDSS